MILTLVSRADPASVNIEAALRQLGTWDAVGTFRGEPVLQHGRLLLATIEGMHLDADLVDAQIRGVAGGAFDAVVVASRHRAESGRPSLTVHPIGNWLEALYGGRPGTVVPPAPGLQAVLLRGLHEAARDLPHDATFEATHHGPFLETPTCFLEIGTNPDHWADPALGRALASLLLEIADADPPPDPPGPVILGVGGGHYAPRFTDLVRTRCCLVGHVLPSYILRQGVPEDAVRQAVEGTAGCSGYVVDDRGGVPRLADVEAVLAEVGLPRVDPTTLEAR